MKNSHIKALIGAGTFFVFFCISLIFTVTEQQNVSHNGLTGLIVLTTLLLMISFVSAFYSTLTNKAERDSKAFTLIVIALFMGFLPLEIFTKVLPPYPEMLVFFIDIIALIALYACAGAAGSLFAVSAEENVTDKKQDKKLDQCHCESSRRELVNLRDKLSTTHKLVYLVLITQSIAIGLFFMIKG